MIFIRFYYLVSIYSHDQINMFEWIWLKFDEHYWKKNISATTNILQKIIWPFI